MPELPQFKDENPVLAPVKVASKAEGYENFAKVLGGLAEKAGSEAKTLASEESSSMLVNSMANIQQTKNQAQIRMLEHPQEAGRIAEQTSTILGEIGQNTAVNKGDRSKLNYHIQTAQGAVGLEAAKTNVKQAQLGAAFTHFANWNDQLKVYTDALFTDHDKAEKIHDAMVSSLSGMVQTGVLTPTQAASSLKSMGEAVKLADDMHRMYGSGDATPRQYQTLAANPLNPNQGVADPNSPIDSQTAWAVNYHNSDRTYQGAMADINNRQLPNPSVFESMTSDQREHAILSMQGMQQADGIINSGTAFPEIAKTYQVLNNKGNVLSYRQSAMRQGLEQYLTDLKNGNYLNVMARDPQGMNIISDFTERNAAINTSLGNDPEKQHAALLANKDAAINASIAWGQGRHIPSEYIQPISQADVANVENAFVAGHNPGDALTILNSYSKQNRVWVANAMKNPNQRMTMQAMAFVPPTVSVRDQQDFIAANQTGRSDLSKKFEDQKTEHALYANVLTNLGPQLRFIQQNYDPEAAAIYQNAMIETTMHYAKYLAQKDENPGAKPQGFLFGANYKTYANKASSIYQSAFPAMSGTNYTVNPNQLPFSVSHSQLDALADYAITHGNKYRGEGMDQAVVHMGLSKSPMKMIISSTNQVQAVTPSGFVAFSAPLTTDLIAHAEQSVKAKQREPGSLFRIKH